MKGAKTRLVDHFLLGTQRCPSCPDDVVEGLKEERRVRGLMREHRKRVAQQDGEVAREAKVARLKELSASFHSGASKPTSRVKQTTLEECEAAAQLEEAQQAVARMWYAMAAPFHAIAFPEVVDAFDAVAAYGAATRSEVFLLPTAPSLRNTRLDHEVARIEAELQVHKSAISSYGMSLQSDGKDNSARRHLVNILTTTPMGSEFRKVVDVSGQSRDAQHTAELLVSAAKEVAETAGSDLVTIITDTPAVNRKAWDIIEKDLPHVSCIPCGGHCMNLHLKHAVKLVPEFQTLIEQCKAVVYRFANVDFAREMLRQCTPACTVDVKFPSGRQIEVYKPGDTRFATNFRMFMRTIELKAAFMRVVTNPDYISKTLQRKEDCPATRHIMDKNFWVQLEEFKGLFWPAYKLLRELDTPKPALHLVYEGGLEIQEHYHASKSKYAKDIANLWKDDWAYMHSPMHSAAHVLNPKYQGGKHSEQHYWSEFLDVLTTQLTDSEGALAVQQFEIFNTKQGIFGKGLVLESMSSMEPYLWWKLYGASVPQLQRVAMRVLSQPASACSSEQSWSEYDFVHNKKRNRLKTKVASKLVYVHANMRLLRANQPYNRHKKALDQAVVAAAASELNNHLGTGGWDGNCSDNDDPNNDDCEPTGGRGGDLGGPTNGTHDNLTQEMICQPSSDGDE